MGSGNLNPLEELNALLAQIDSANDIDALRPVFAQLNEIVQHYPGDFEVQLAGSEIRDRLLARGRLLRSQPAPIPVDPHPAAGPPPPSTLPAVVAPLPAAARSPARRPSRPMTLLEFIGLAIAIVILSLVVSRLYAPKDSPPIAGSAKPPSNVAATPPAPAGALPSSQPPPQTLRLLTDLDQGSVTVDGQTPVELHEGQLILDKLSPGSHTVKVASTNRDAATNREASFSFEVADARPPAVVGPLQTRNLIAVLVASLGKQARVVTSGGPWKLAVNGQAQADVGPAGTDLANFRAGVDEIVVSDGQGQHNMFESFPDGPMLTVFLKADINAGTLIVSTGQDDVRVFLNGKEYRRRTLRGQLRIPIIGSVVVNVAKNGFQEAPPQTVEVKKGAEVRVQFELKPLPQVGSLDIRGGTPGAEVWLDQRIAGVVGTDGSFTLGAIQPGEHAVELRRQQFLPKKMQRAFRAGETTTLSGADAVLAAATGTLRFTRNPSAAAIAWRRAGESESHDVRGDQIDLPPGSYALSATAPGFAQTVINVQLAAGESRDLEFKLARERVAPPAPAPGGMTDFEDAGAWRKDGDVWVRKGGGFSLFKLPPRGVFTFTVSLVKGGGVFRSGQIRWCVQYLDSKDYLQYEVDRKNFSAWVIEKGKRYERSRTPHGLDGQRTFTIQVEVTPDSLVHRMRVGGEWKLLDTFSEPGRDFTKGRFGFQVPGNEEIAISDFKFVRR